MSNPTDSRPLVGIIMGSKSDWDAMKAAGVKLDYVLEIDVPFDAIIERMSGRRSHQPSGRTYHV